MRIWINLGVDLESLILQLLLIEYLAQSKFLFVIDVKRAIFSLWTELNFFDIMRICLL